MNLLVLFNQYLLLQKNQPSKSTIKNYRADVGQFINWFEHEFKKPFDPDAITPQIIELYKSLKNINVSNRSLDRHMSSLRRFFNFLKEQGITSSNPLEIGNWKLEIGNSDPFHLKQFKDYLYTHNTAYLTIKNYIMDIRQFLEWAQSVTKANESWLVEDKNIFSKINNLTLEEYKNRLLQKGTSPVSINRKLSSIRKYVKWAIEKNFIKNFDLEIKNTEAKEEIDPQKLNDFAVAFDQKDKINTTQQPKSSYSRFPPIRLFQRLSRGTNFVLDEVLIEPLTKVVQVERYLLWKIKGKPVFVERRKTQNKTQNNAELGFSLVPRNVSRGSVMPGNISKEFYAPLSISITHFSIYRKLLYHARHTRPNWYKRYHSYPIAHYIHFAILIIFMSAIGFSFYNKFAKEPQKQTVLGTSTSSRILSFKGKLADDFGNSITETKNVRFSIYNKLEASGSALLWQDVYPVTPDKDGNFSVLLGNSGSQPLQQNIFTDNNALYLGITIATGNELIPRQQLTNVSYAANADTLQGLSPITDLNAGTKNVILALDSSGNLTIGDNSSTVFQATGGDFKLSGQSLVLSTNIGSGGNIILAPDAGGTVDIQKPLQNSTNYSNIPGMEGAVEVDDNFAILATSSSQPALSINQNDSGTIISASASGFAKFWVSNSGKGYFADNLSIGTQDSNLFKLQVAGNIGPNNDLTFNLGSSSARFAKAYISEVIGIESGIQGYLKREKSVLSPTNINDSLNLGGSATSSALIHLAGMTGENSFFREGNVGIGTTNPMARLDINGTASISGNLTFNAAALIASTARQSLTIGDSQTGNIILNPSGNIGIATTNPGYALQVGNAGDGTEARANAWNSLSDKRLKENVKDLSNSLDKVLSLNGVSFDWKNNGRHSIGFIAQDVEAVVPEIVSTGTDGYKSLDYSKLTALLVNAIKSQQSQLASVSSEISIINNETMKQWDNENLSIQAFDPATGEYKNVDLTVEAKNDGKADIYRLNDAFGKPITKIGVFAKIASAGITAGAINAYKITTTTLAATSANIKDLAAEQITSLSANIGQLNVDSLIVSSDSIVIAGQNIRDYIANNVNTINNETMKQWDNETVISPISKANNLYTNIISPLSSDTINVNGKLIISGRHSGLSRIDSGVASQSGAPQNDTVLDVQGDASVSGNLNANQASIAGTLRADRIVANDIEGLENRIATIAANLLRPTATPTPSPVISSNARDLTTEISLSGRNDNNNLTNQQSSTSAIASSSLDTLDTLDALDALDALNVDFARFNQGIISFGPTSLSDTSITGQLSIGSGFILSQNSINTLGSTLEIQPLRQGGLSIMGGMVSIDTNGNLKAMGDAEFAKDVTIRGQLATNFISPISDNNLVIQLGKNKKHTSPLDTPDTLDTLDTPGFVVQNASGSSVMTINSSGDLSSSGSGNFKDLIAKTFNIVRGAQADTSLTETIATSSAGTATIITGETERTIVSPFVTEKSLIYITPASDTQGLTPYIARQTAEIPKGDKSLPAGRQGSFTIQIPERTNKNIVVNWWIIN